MKSCWYIVKTNWAQIETRCRAYAGIGGDVWPLASIDSSEAKVIQSVFERSREPVGVGASEELLCAKLSTAEDYWKEAQRHLKNVWLLEVRDDLGPDPKRDGFDIGFASGGFSIVESELINQGMSGPRLNHWGLVDSLDEACGYLASRKEKPELEDAQDLLVLSIRVLRGVK